MNVITKYKYLLIILLIAVISAFYIVSKDNEKMENNYKDDKGEEIMSKDIEKEEVKLSVISSAFNNGDSIPVKYTGRGEDISIPLEFNNIISSGKSIAIIMDDPDAPSGTFTHWLIWNIPTTITKISENVPTDKIVSSLRGAIQGKNDFGRIGYKGPNPPSRTHTYRIKVYVLDCLLDLKSNASKESLENAMEAHILQYSLLEGTFSR